MQEQKSRSHWSGKAATAVTKDDPDERRRVLNDNRRAPKMKNEVGTEDADLDSNILAAARNKTRKEDNKNTFFDIIHSCK